MAKRDTNREAERTDETSDDDWLFARSIYLKLKNIPAGRDKESFKLRMQGELMSLTYCYQSSGFLYPTSHSMYRVECQQPTAFPRQETYTNQS